MYTGEDERDHNEKAKWLGERGWEFNNRRWENSRTSHDRVESAIAYQLDLKDEPIPAAWIPSVAKYRSPGCITLVDGKLTDVPSQHLGHSPDRNRQYLNETIGEKLAENLITVLDELAKADDKYSRMGDPREGIRTLQCEVMELDREIERQNKDYTAYRKEAVQVAAMGLKFLRDCGSEEDFKKLLKSCKC